MKGTFSVDVDKILLQLKNGDNRAMATLYDATCKQLMSICYGYFHDRQLSEDALSESYIKIYKEIDKFGGKNGFNWIYTITKNLCINLLKKKKHDVLTDFLDEKNATLLIDDSSSPALEDESGIIECCRKVLKETEFQIVIMHAVGGIKFKEIAKVLNKLEASVRWTYNNALNKIRKNYKREED